MSEKNTNQDRNVVAAEKMNALINQSGGDVEQLGESFIQEAGDLLRGVPQGELLQTIQEKKAILEQNELDAARIGNEPAVTYNQGVKEGLNVIAGVSESGSIEERVRTVLSSRPSVDFKFNLKRALEKSWRG